MSLTSFASGDSWVRLMVRPLGQSWQLTEMVDNSIRPLGTFSTFSLAMSAMTDRKSSIVESAVDASADRESIRQQVNFYGVI